MYNFCSLIDWIQLKKILMYKLDQIENILISDLVFSQNKWLHSEYSPKCRIMVSGGPKTIATV